MHTTEPAAQEKSRVEDLRSYEILDTPCDVRFDTFVKVAADVYSVPISLISLIDSDRQWFKAAIGINVSETPRDIAFCAHAIATPDKVMVVEDATKDPRFAANPLVTGEPGIRFYAGAPIISEGTGLPMGTLCIMDRTPRTLDDAGRRRLQDLALGVAAVMDLHRSVIRLQRAASHDILTGLANRAIFEPRLDLEAAGATPDHRCAVLCLDLDRFKAINDTMGHEAGDTVLSVAAARLRGAVRETDLPARLGGDEFVVLMHGPFPAFGPRLLAERIIAAFAEPVIVAGKAIPLGVSIGYAIAPDDGMDGPSLLRAADMAMYRAKSAGRGGIAGAADLATPLLARRPRSMEDDLRDALAADALTLAWQPYVASRTGRVLGHEALVRWSMPGRGVIPPGQFVPMAEATGLIADLDAWVLRRACAQAAAWPVAQRVGVNITPYWFCLGDLMGLVETALADTGLPPERLVLEMTERTLIDHPETASARIADLHRHGIKVALDDFGTGYSSLGCLSAFPFDILKLDISFVRAAGHDPRADAVLRNILRLARDLAMDVCAEGVETPAQYQTLRALDCPAMQGYYLATPSAQPQFTLEHVYQAIALPM